MGKERHLTSAGEFDFHGLQRIRAGRVLVSGPVSVHAGRCCLIEWIVSLLSVSLCQHCSYRDQETCGCHHSSEPGCGTVVRSHGLDSFRIKRQDRIDRKDTQRKGKRAAVAAKTTATHHLPPYHGHPQATGKFININTAEHLAARPSSGKLLHPEQSWDAFPCTECA